MSKKFHCSICGIELTYTRKAIPGKGEILNLITPHSCEGYAVKESPDESETVLEILDRLKPVGVPKMVTDDKPSSNTKLPFISDTRDTQKTSSAPAALLSQFSRDDIGD